MAPAPDVERGVEPAAVGPDVRSHDVGNGIGIGRGALSGERPAGAQPLTGSPVSTSVTSSRTMYRQGTSTRMIEVANTIPNPSEIAIGIR